MRIGLLMRPELGRGLGLRMEGGLGLWPGLGLGWAGTWTEMSIRTVTEIGIAQNGPILGQIIRLRLGLRLGLWLCYDWNYI